MSKLSSPIKVGNLAIKNRLVMPPMATSKSSAEGHVTDEILAYYNEKSMGGYIGLIIIEHAFVAPEGKASNAQLSICKDSDISGLRDLVDVIHKNGSMVFAQINHAGGAAKAEITKMEVLAASEAIMPRSGLSFKMMALNDIEKVVADFASAAIRVKEAGFDGVEIHSAHGYLLNQFYSPITNKRTDEYGPQTINSRLKLHLEIIKAIRKVVGDNYPIALRLGACDYMAGGSTIEDAVNAAKLFQSAGVDLLDISGGFCGYIHPEAVEPGYFSDASAAICQSVDIPIILTGGITDAKSVEALLAAHKADMIGVGRAILKDSLWAKAAINETE